MRKNRISTELNIIGAKGVYTITKEAIYSLFVNGIIPNSIEGEPPFTWLMRNNFELLKIITNNGDLDELLGIAISLNDIKGTKYYIKRGANAWKPEFACVAVYLGYTEIVKMLLKAGTNPDAEDGYLIQVASEKGFTEIVGMLIEAGAKVDIFDNYAIKAANENKYYDVVCMLEKAGGKL